MSILLAVEGEATCMSMMLALVGETPCMSILLVVEEDAPCMSILLILVVVKGIPTVHVQTSGNGKCPMTAVDDILAPRVA